jgi:hypothetical protein
MPREIVKVDMLGYDAPLKFDRTSDALVLTLPEHKPNDIAYSFRIATA